MEQSVPWEGPGGPGRGWHRVPEPQPRPQRSKRLAQAQAAESLLLSGVRGPSGREATGQPLGAAERAVSPAWLRPLLTSAHSDIKEVASVCNQSLMKLVTPEDDEPDEPRPVVQKQAGPSPEDCAAKQEGAACGEWALPPAPTSQRGPLGAQRLENLTWGLPQPARAVSESQPLALETARQVGTAAFLQQVGTGQRSPTTSIRQLPGAGGV